MTAIHAAGHTILARDGRVWLHRQTDSDGDLAADQALAHALEEAAAIADRQQQQATVDELARRARRALRLAVEYTMGDEEDSR